VNARVKRYLRIGAQALAAVFVAIQLVPVQRTNRLGTGDPHAPREVQWILRRACYDCHSTETRWPIWAYVAPMSWQVVSDVERARRRINFSDWASYDSLQRQTIRHTVSAMTAAHKMPLWNYVVLHPDARLTQSDIALLARWARDSTFSAPAAK
jgi:hypothetical protein